MTYFLKQNTKVYFLTFITFSYLLINIFKRYFNQSLTYYEIIKSTHSKVSRNFKKNGNNMNYY